MGSKSLECMFCEQTPCVCGKPIKSAKKTAPKKSTRAPLKPGPVAPAAAPSDRSTGSRQPLRSPPAAEASPYDEPVRILLEAGMLHPSEVARFAHLEPRPSVASTDLSQRLQAWKESRR